LQRKALCFLFSTIKHKIVGYASFALMPSNINHSEELAEAVMGHKVVVLQ
jgi:hypothetical protein